MGGSGINVQALLLETRYLAERSTSFAGLPVAAFDSAGPVNAIYRLGDDLCVHQAALIIPYYAETNPPFAAMARRTIEQILTEVPSPGGS